MTQTVLLGDIATVQTGPFGSQLHQKDYVDNGTPIVTVEHLGQDRMTRQNLPKVSDNDKERLSKYILKEGDTVFSRVGSVDRASYVHTEESGWMFSGRCLRVSPDVSKVNPRFLSFLLRSPKFTDYIKSIAVGATMPSINTKLLSSAPIMLPERQIQDKVAITLDSIEQKIELNRKMNETLEKMGQALFRHYFITNPEVERWEDGLASDLVTIYSGYAFKRSDFDPDGKYGLVTIKNVQDGSFLAECSDHLTEVPAQVPDYIHLKTGDVLLSLTGNVGRVCIAYGENMLLNQRVAKLAGANNRHSFAYFMFRQNEFKDKLISMARGTAQLNLSPVETKKIKMKLPPEDTLENFYSEAEPFFEMITDNYQQIQTLTTLRDTLLPRLINGKLKV